MGDGTADTQGAEAVGVADAFVAARGLLESAGQDAARLRAEAERYARQREQEADLLVQKARRVLLAAEEKAAVIISTARAEAATMVDGVIDLDDLGHIIAPGATVLGHGAVPSRLDKLLAAAIAHAVTDAFPVDASA